MSQWTHVAATIRFDALRALGSFPAPDLGNTCSFDSPGDDWDASDVPCGSEGSLQTDIWTNPSSNDLAAYTAMIWGDLRDYQDVAEITAYLTRICKGQMVRQGVAVIEVEYQDAVVLHWDEGKWRQAALRAAPASPIGGPFHRLDEPKSPNTPDYEADLGEKG